MIALLKKLMPDRVKKLIAPVAVRLGLVTTVMTEGAAVRKLQNEVITALALRARGDPRAGEALICPAFKSRPPSHPSLPREYVRDFLEAAGQRRSFVLPNEAPDILLQHTRSLDVSCLPSRRWVLLHCACIHNGLFTAGGVARENAIEAAYREASDTRASGESLVQGCKAAIDQGDFESADRFLGRLRSVDPRNSLIRDLQKYHCLNRGDIHGLQALGTDKLSKQDSSFSEYIKGRSIAVVGPAPSGSNVGAEIDSFDVVIRFNYRGRQFLPDPREFGSRVDVSNYAFGLVKYISTLRNLAFFDDLRFAVFKGLTHDFQKHLLKAGRGRILNKNYLLFNGFPMALQHALFDLLHFAPPRLKLFHVNFFLTRTRYHTGYSIAGGHRGTPEDVVSSAFMRWYSFSLHGIVNQLNFTRNLWKAGLVEADSGCEDVLRLTPAEYLSKMEELYVIDPVNEYQRRLEECADGGS